MGGLRLHTDGCLSRTFQVGESRIQVSFPGISWARTGTQSFSRQLFSRPRGRKKTLCANSLCGDLCGKNRRNRGAHKVFPARFAWRSAVSPRGQGPENFVCQFLCVPISLAEERGSEGQIVFLDTKLGPRLCSSGISHADVFASQLLAERKDTSRKNSKIFKTEIALERASEWVKSTFDRTNRDEKNRRTLW